MKKIHYYTSLHWWGEDEAKAVTPTGYDFELHKLKGPLPKTLIKSTYVMDLIFKNIKGHIHYVGGWDERLSSWRGTESRHSGRSIIRSFVKKQYVKYDKRRKSMVVKRGGRPQWLYTPEHENIHMLSKELKKVDRLDEWTSKGDYDIYVTQYLNKNLKKNNDLLPLVKRQLKTFKTIMNFIDPIVVVDGFRSIEEQDALYAKGRTAPGKKVTNAKGGESMHNYGIALDYRFAKKPIYPESGDKRWKLANAIATALGFYSYGLEEGWDDGHLQIMNDYTEKNIRSGKVDWTKWN